MVFIHGLWLHSTSWQPWIELFRDEGYDPSAPGPSPVDVVIFRWRIGTITDERPRLTLHTWRARRQAPSAHALTCVDTVERAKPSIVD
ncbi:hypothetical protein [Streptomyces sp. NPDC002763]|uniref:hypothetical protein n=1 Tax=Streptomyces sp. NPDC002763 TaxID=3154427 RepID=UPI00332741D8